MGNKFGYRGDGGVGRSTKLLGSSFNVIYNILNNIRTGSLTSQVCSVDLVNVNCFEHGGFDQIRVVPQTEVF